MRETFKLSLKNTDLELTKLSDCVYLELEESSKYNTERMSVVLDLEQAKKMRDELDFLVSVLDGSLKSNLEFKLRRRMMERDEAKTPESKEVLNKVVEEVLQELDDLKYL